MSNPVFRYTPLDPPVAGYGGFSAMVDIDGDNDLDGFAGNYDGTISFLRNTGTATHPAFAAPITNPFGLKDVGSKSVPTFVDIDNDGDFDALVGNNGGNTRFFRNEGTANNPVFVAAGINPFGLVDVGFRASPTFADIDKDGDLDAFIGYNNIYTWFFENTGTISNPIFTTNNSLGFWGYANFADIDNDGDLDVFSSLYDGVVFYRNIGTINNPHYYFDNYNPFGLSWYVGIFADIDDDGDLDTSIMNYGFMQNAGPGYSPSFHGLSQFDFGRIYYANPAIVDIDNDGDIDMFVVGGQDNTPLFYENTGTITNPSFAAAVDNPFGLGTTDYYARLTFVDIDGDGDFDSFISSTYGGNILFSQNIGTSEAPAFAAAVTHPFDFSHNGSAIDFADIDDDGDFDVFVVNDSGTQFFQNTGSAVSPSFAPVVTSAFGLSAGRAGVSFVDIDRDGDLDAFSGSSGTNMAFFHNIGTASNPEFYNQSSGLYGFIAGGGRYSTDNTPVFADMDGDGDFDAFIGVYLGVGYFINNNAPNAFNLSTAEIYTPNTLLDLNNIIVEDPDSANVTAILTLSNVEAGSLSTGTSGTVTSIFDATTGVWSASGALVDVNTLLAGVIFTPASNFSGNFSIDTSVSDGVAAPLLGRKSFTVAADVMLFSTPGNDHLVGTSSLNDTVSYESATAPVTVSLNIATQQNTLGAGLDTLKDIENLIGSDFADHLTGNAANNTLQGRSGDDVLTGWSGEDTMIGGPGNDSYFVENTRDIVIEAFSQGIDSVNSSVTYTLPNNVENLILRGSSAINGTGNGQANTITGNVASNVLKGGDGNDILLGGAGNDTLEGEADRDTLDGGFGTDILKGGSGNDNYVVDNTGDSIIEAAGGGIDGVNSSVTYTLPNNVENLTLRGTSAINGIGNGQANTITGNVASNVLKGGAGNDILLGGAGNDTLEGGTGRDTLDGGFGADVLKGGTGNDNYVVDNTGDSIIEAAGGGIDGVNSSVTFALPAQVENLTLTGTSAINGTGNNLANIIIGNTGKNQLKGAAGNDILDGRQGADILTGGIGNDIFRFTTLGQIDTITDFNVVNDTIQLENAVFTALTATGTLAAGRFRIGANALDANDNIIYNSATGALIYDANGNGAGAAVQIATIGTGLALTHADIVVI